MMNQLQLFFVAKLMWFNTFGLLKASIEVDLYYLMILKLTFMSTRIFIDIIWRLCKINLAFDDFSRENLRLLTR